MRVDGGRVNLLPLGSRYLLAHGPSDGASVILDLPLRRVAFRGTASHHVELDGRRFVLSGAGVGTSGSPATTKRWSVDAAGRLLTEPWSGPHPPPEGRSTEPWRVPLRLAHSAGRQLCKVGPWIVPIEACAP